MRPDAARFRVPALASGMCLAVATACNTASLQPSQVVADSVKEFSGTQGVHGWYYGYWDRSTDTDLTYDQASDFRLLTHFGGDPLNRLRGHTKFTTGDLWNLQDGLYYTSLWAEGGHANTTLDLGAHARTEQWAVRRWISTVGGRITMGGHAGKVMPWGENWSGGVLAVIVVDGAELFRADIGSRSTNYSIETTLREGSLVDFLIGPNPSVGVIKFTALVRAAPGLQR